MTIYVSSKNAPVDLYDHCCLLKCIASWYVRDGWFIETNLERGKWNLAP